MRASRKAEMGRFLSSMDWPSLFTSFESCEDMLSMFCETIHAGLDLLIPVKKVRVCSSVTPWMTQHLKSLILKRQKAFHNKGPKSLQYKLYRNVVNRERKVCKANFYKLKVENMKEKNQRVWWKEVKRLCGALQHSSDLISQIHAHDVQELSPNDLANAINDAFLEPLKEYRLHQPLTKSHRNSLIHRSSVYTSCCRNSIHERQAVLMIYLIGYYVNTLTSSLIQLVR